MRNLLRQVISIERPTNTQTSDMGVSQANTAVYSGIAASIQPASSSVQDFYAERQLKVGYTVFVAGGLGLKRGDRLSDGVLAYQVIGWRDLSGRGKVQAIDCELYEV